MNVPTPDIPYKPLQGWTADGGAETTSVVIAGGQRPPAFMSLARCPPWLWQLLLHHRVTLRQGVIDEAHERNRCSNTVRYSADLVAPAEVISPDSGRDDKTHEHSRHDAGQEAWRSQ